MSRNPMRGFQYLRGDYVYYQRLRTDGYYPNLGEHVNFRQFARVKKASNLSRISQFFNNAAAAELSKEKDLLIQKFGQDISGSYEDMNFAGDLITAINSCLGIKKIFERNLALIKESRGQKNVMSFFPTYFQKVWERHSDEIFNDAAGTFTGSNNLVLGEALAQTVDKRLPDLVREAVLDMFNAKVESGIKENRDSYADAYKELSAAVESGTDSSNEFIQSFIKNYHLNEFVETIRKSIENMPQFKQALTKNFNIKSQMAQRGGLTMEDFRTFAFNFVGEGLREAYGSDTVGVTVGGFSTGSTKMKPDSIATIDIPIDIIEDWVKNNTFGTREKDTAAILKLQDSLRNFNDGFITYVNAKNYTINEYFKHGTVRADGSIQLPGFSAGSMVSLQNFQAAADNLNVNYRNLIDICLQLIPGAIGEDMVDDVKLALTEAIASALFDDFNVVGTVESSGAKSVHLLDLNGVLTPISFYFYLLGQAFDQVSKLEAQDAAKDLISVEIDTPDQILYPNKTPDEQRGGGPERWNRQSVDAMTKIKIGYHFLSAFQEIMQLFV